MIIFNPTNIVKNLAINSPQLLFMIASLPEINCNTFSFEKWKNKINLQCIEYDNLETNWRIISCGMITMNHINIKHISELIDVCKDKNFEELLNFI